MNELKENKNERYWPSHNIMASHDISKYAWGVHFTICKTTQPTFRASRTSPSCLCFSSTAASRCVRSSMCRSCFRYDSSCCVTRFRTLVIGGMFGVRTGVAAFTGDWGGGSGVRIMQLSESFLNEYRDQLYCESEYIITRYHIGYRYSNSYLAGYLLLSYLHFTLGRYGTGTSEAVETQNSRDFSGDVDW